MVEIPCPNCQSPLVLAGDAGASIDPGDFRNCQHCHRPFLARRYDKTKFCSQVCVAMSRTFPLDPSALFWPRVDTSRGPDNCWTWTGRTAVFGYGQFTSGGKNYAAHRYSYELHHGPIPDGLFVRHTCDNPPCVNPQHLIVGTHVDNMRDAVERGRIARGAKVKGAQFTDDTVASMRQEYAAGGVTLKDLAARHSATYASVVRAIRGETWAHVNVPAVPSRKLRETPAHIILAIRSRHAAGEKQSDLARQYGLRSCQVSRIVNHKAFAHIA